MNSERRFRNFVVILYPENFPEGFDLVDYLGEMAVRMCLSPLHTPEGRKPHYHLIVSFDSVQPASTLQSMLEIIKVPKVLQCLSPVSMWRYLQHMDNPTKQQWEGDQRVYLGGYVQPSDYDAVVSSATDFINFCNDRRIYSIRKLFMAREVPASVLRFAVSRTGLAKELIRIV